MKVAKTLSAGCSATLLQFATMDLMLRYTIGTVWFMNHNMDHINGPYLRHVMWYLWQVMSPVCCFCHYSYWYMSRVWFNIICFPAMTWQIRRSCTSTWRGEGGATPLKMALKRIVSEGDSLIMAANRFPFRLWTLREFLKKTTLYICRCGENIDGALCTASTAETFLLDTDTMWSTDPTQNPAFHDFARVGNHIFVKKNHNKKYIRSMFLIAQVTCMLEQEIPQMRSGDTTSTANTLLR